MDDSSKNEAKIRKVSGLQEQIDALVTEIDSNYNSPEMKLVRQKLIEAEHWCDEYIGVLGGE